MKRICLPLPSHHPSSPCAGVCCGTVMSHRWDEIHTFGSYLSSPLPGQPHGLVVSSTSPSPDVSGQDHGVAQQHHGPYFITCPVLPHPVHKVAWWEKTLRRSIPAERKSVKLQQLHPPALSPWAHFKIRGHSIQKNTATALPRGGGRKQMSNGISMALFLLQTLQLCSASPWDLPSMMI